MSPPELITSVPLEGWIFLASFWALVISVILAIILGFKAHIRSTTYLGILVLGLSLMFMYHPLFSSLLIAAGTVVTVISMWWPIRAQRIPNHKI